MTERTWEDWSDDAVKRDRDAAQSGGEFLKIPGGDSYWRFMPPLRGVPSPFKVTWQHFIGKDDLDIPGRDGKPLVFNCPTMVDEPCLTCEKADALAKSRLKEDRDLAKSLRPGLRVFANVVNMDNPDAGVQILPFGRTIHNGLLEIRENQRKGGNFTHPKTGRVIIINRTGQGLKTEYTVTADASGPEELENYGWISEQHDLESLVQFPTEEDEALVLAAIEDATGHSSSAAALPQQRKRRITKDAKASEATTRTTRKRKAGASFKPRTAQDALDGDEVY